jgi:hypothetical protein
MKRCSAAVWWVPAVLILALLTGGPACGADEPALSNGDAETGATRPWTVDNVVSVQVVNQSTGAVHPYEGQWFFSMTERPGLAGTLVQTNALPGAVDWLQLSGWVQTEYDDFGTAYLSAHDGRGRPLAVATNGPMVTALFEWVPFEVDLPVPERAVTWRVELRGTLAFGTFVNVFFDDVRLRGFEGEPLAITNIWHTAAGRPALAWTAGMAGAVYTVEATTSLVNAAFMPVVPTSQWPIVRAAWTNPHAPQAVELYRVRGRL